MEVFSSSKCSHAFSCHYLFFIVSLLHTSPSLTKADTPLYSSYGSSVNKCRTPSLDVPTAVVYRMFNSSLTLGVMPTSCQVAGVGVARLA